MYFDFETLKRTVDGSVNIFLDHKGEVETFSDFYALAENYSDASGEEGLLENIVNLANTLTSMTNAHINKVENLRVCLKDLQSAMAEQAKFEEFEHGEPDPELASFLGFSDTNSVWGYDEYQIAQMLFQFNPEKYAYEDRDRFYGLQSITDSDFIDYKNLSDDDYRLVYGILYNVNAGAEIYDCIAHSFNRYAQPIKRKALLLHWDKLFQKVIDNLKACIEKGNGREIRVYIPFLAEYEYTASDTIELFRMGQDIVRLLRDTDCAEALVLEDEDCYKEVLPMQKMMEQYALDDADGGVDGWKADAIFAEMSRRGLLPNTTYRDSELNYKRDIICKGKEEEERIQIEIEETNKETLLTKVATLYYMFTSVGIGDLKMMNRFAHFMLQDDMEYKGSDSGRDSIYTYLYSLDNGKIVISGDAETIIRAKLKKYKYSSEFISNIFKPKK